MTIPVDIQRESFVGDGSTKTFSFNSDFVWWNDSELQVYHEDLTTEVLTEWRQGVNYKLPTGGKGVFGGTILTAAEDALTSNDKIHVLRILPLRHKIDFENGKTLDFESVERSDDRLVAIMQQIDEGITRTIRVPLNESADFTWPTKLERRDKYLGFVNDTEAEPTAFDEPSAVDLGDNLEAIEAQITPASGYVIEWTGANTCQLILTSSLTGADYEAYASYSPPTAPPGALINSYEFFTGLSSLNLTQIEIFWYNVQQNGNNPWRIQLGTSGGYASSGYTCSTVSKTVGGNTTGANTTGFLVPCDLAGEQTRGRSFLHRATGNNWVYRFAGQIDENAPETAVGGGEIALGGALDRLQILTTGGIEWNAGTWRLTYRVV